MAAPRARWLALCSIAGWAACSPAAAPRSAVAPTEPSAQRARSTSTLPPAEPPVAAPIVEPAIVEPPPAAPIVEPPPAVEPVVAVPPCPNDTQRDPHQKPDHVVQLVELSESMTVVDLGSGNGYFLCRLSRAVGGRGHVIATEVARNLVRDLKKRIAREQLSNVEVVQAPTDDVGIAPGTADRILLVNVWHHLGNRRRYATRVARALSPGGKVVIVEFPPSGRRSSHGIMPERVLAELAAGGIDGTVVSEELADQYVIIGSVRPATSDAHTR